MSDGIEVEQMVESKPRRHFKVALDRDEMWAELSWPLCRLAARLGQVPLAFVNPMPIANIDKMPVATSIDKEAVREAYEDVRSDLTGTEWAVFKFDGARILCTARGQCFEEFRNQFNDDERAFGYIRITMGDEMSKRKKFIFLTWIGQEVGVIQRAKMSTDKALIKDVLNNFAVELQAGLDNELDIELFREALNRAGGANYGTGVRD